MNNPPGKFLNVLVLFFLTSCATTQSSLIVADRYDEIKNQTSLTILPYGNIVLPGRWTKTRYNQISRQHFFRNSDSTTVAVAKNPKQDYPFFTTEQTDKEFVTEFVKWDAEFWEKQKLSVKTIIDSSESGFILWQVTDSIAEVNTILLFGSKNGFAYNFSGTSKAWTDEQIQSFLIKLYNDN